MIESGRSNICRHSEDFGGTRAPIPSENGESGLCLFHLQKKTEFNEICAAFGYTLSRFTYSDSSVFRVSEGDWDYPIVIDCSDRSCSDYCRMVDNQMAACRNVSVFETSELYDSLPVSGRMLVTDNDRYDAAEYDLVLAAEGAEAIIIHSDRYSAEFAASFKDTFLNILNGLGSEGDLSDIIYCSATEEFRQDSISGREAPLIFKDIVTAFGDSAVIYGKRPFIIYGDRTVSYGEADQITDSIAYELQKHGTTLGSCVGIMVNKCEWSALCPLGAMKAGAVYVPLDVGSSDDEIREMLAQVGIHCILTDTYNIRRAKLLSNCEIIDIDDISKGKPKKMHLENMDAAIMFSYGVNGRPRGLPISHRSIANFVQWRQEIDGLSCEDIIAWYAPMTFISHVSSIYTAIVAGAAVDIVPDCISKDVKALCRHFRNYHVTQSFMTPEMARSVIENGDVTPVRNLVVDGRENEDMHRLDNLSLSESYGSTEVIGILLDKYRSGKKISNICNNTRPYILDRELRRVPYGGIGRLYISGYPISSGYVDERFNDCFLPNPLSKNPLYRILFDTGDIFGYTSPDGITAIGLHEEMIRVPGMNRGTSVCKPSPKNKVPAALPVGDISVL